jgi:hypothetical protein
MPDEVKISEPKPKNHLIWVDPDEFDELLDAAEGVINEMIESVPMDWDTYSRFVIAVRTFRPPCVPEKTVL